MQGFEADSRVAGTGSTARIDKFVHNVASHPAMDGDRLKISGPISVPDPLCFGSIHSRSIRSTSIAQAFGEAGKGEAANDARRVLQIRQEKRRSNGGPEVRGHARELAALLVPDRSLGRQHVQGRARLRWFINPRMDGYSRIRHAGRAGCGYGVYRSVLLQAHG